MSGIGPRNVVRLIKELEAYQHFTAPGEVDRFLLKSIKVLTEELLDITSTKKTKSQ